VYSGIDIAAEAIGSLSYSPNLRPAGKIGSEIKLISSDVNLFVFIEVALRPTPLTRSLLKTALQFAVDSNLTRWMSAWAFVFICYFQFVRRTFQTSRVLDLVFGRYGTHCAPNLT
jgi:hypothetical protein